MNDSTKTPLLVIGDAPSAISGLGRICRDLSTRIAEHMSDIFEVATLGYGGHGDRNLPFLQYHIEGMENWYLPTLPQVWENFAGKRKGVVLTIWDASRLLWFARPDNQHWCHDANMRAWLSNAPFQRWGYFPMDALGPHGRLSVMNRECLLGYDRILAYSHWAEKMISGSMLPEDSEKRALTFLPHGIDTDVFKPRDQAHSRKIFHSTLAFKGPEIREEERIIGIVATNQARKDFGLGIESVAKVAQTMPIRLFIQTDILERHWSIPALLMDYGILPRAIVSGLQVSDEVMSYVYSACDLTLGIGAGEGFGYPLAESIACGTPVIHGDYGGGAEFLPKKFLINPSAYRTEGTYNALRPVFQIGDWVKKIREIIGKSATLPEHLDWNVLWPRWEQYLRQGHESFLTVKAKPEYNRASPVLAGGEPSSEDKSDNDALQPI